MNRSRHRHRAFAGSHRDFRTCSPAKLLYDGGFAIIDGAIAKTGDRYYLVMKDETFYPSHRYLRVASSAHATGPYGPASPPFTEHDTEGPSILHAGDWWYVYYDEYTRGRYGAVRTHDFVHWEKFTDSLKAPRGMRHGPASNLSPFSVPSVPPWCHATHHAIP